MKKRTSNRKTKSPYARQEERAEDSSSSQTLQLNKETTGTQKPQGTTTMTTEEVQTSDQPPSIPAGSESINDIQINLANSVNTPQVLQGTSFNLGFNVDVSIRNKIIEGKYIDLALLLKTDANSSMSNSFQLSPSGELIIKPKTNQKIATIARWTDAILTFSSNYLSAHPKKTQEILKYMHDVRIGAERGGNFIKYDEQFRLRQSFEQSASWENIDSKLWLMYMSGNSHTNTPQTQTTKGKCFAFNFQGSCTKSECIYAHLCMKCGKPHSANYCTLGRDNNVQQIRPHLQPFRYPGQNFQRFQSRARPRFMGPRGFPYQNSKR
ncbi:hypothetical protein FSP39_013266 [Pinctada imbricata]|uniref:C3H1-type domain-containing protein n=1 Tax=Pinctada imbricata TaxID=66713 RepID=A0AA88YJW3_PINIB|nr:hypothetical protein FSP39_013266 [Pinctada imbricata]